MKSDVRLSLLPSQELENPRAYLEWAEEVASYPDWNEEQQANAHMFIADLAHVIRGILVLHREASRQCRSCRTPWPCAEYQTIERLVVSPEGELAALELVSGDRAATA